MTRVNAEKPNPENQPEPPEAIVDAVFYFAKKECGHNPVSGQHALTTIQEYVRKLKEQKSPTEIWGLFYTVSDDCTYSYETLVSVYLTKDDAETSLLKLIETAEYHHAQEKAFGNRENYQNLPAYSEVVQELNAWRMETFGCTENAWMEMRDPDIDKYIIRPLKIGELR